MKNLKSNDKKLSKLQDSENKKIIIDDDDIKIKPLLENLELPQINKNYSLEIKNNSNDEFTESKPKISRRRTQSHSKTFKNQKISILDTEQDVYNKN